MRARFGHQHWWPGETPFEVCVGAILTQNTAWSNVERAIANLKAAQVLEPEKLYALPEVRLAELIRPAGYFNVKARRLRAFLRALLDQPASERAVNVLPCVPPAEPISFHEPSPFGVPALAGSACLASPLPNRLKPGLQTAPRRPDAPRVQAFKARNPAWEDSLPDDGSAGGTHGSTLECLNRFFAGTTAEVRERLLAIKGIGPETADSMLLYAGGHSSFVIDAYTKRIFARHGWVEPNPKSEIRNPKAKSAPLQPVSASHVSRFTFHDALTVQPDYDGLKAQCEAALGQKSGAALLDYWQDYHAQLVMVGKHFCRPRDPRCADCPLQPLLPRADASLHRRHG
jgi:endonuclease III-like uncharacterized protein